MKDSAPELNVSSSETEEDKEEAKPDGEKDPDFNQVRVEAAFFFSFLLIYLLIMLLQLSHISPFTPLHPAHPLPPKFPPDGSCPWVIHISSLASTFPILF